MTNQDAMWLLYNIAYEASRRISDPLIAKRQMQECDEAKAKIERLVDIVGNDDPTEEDVQHIRDTLEVDRKTMERPGHWTGRQA